MLFSANLGFLWADRPLDQAIFAAKRAGFDAVECHWPYESDPALIWHALQKADLQMISLNTRRGDVAAGDNGLTALPDKVDEARRAICQAIDYASQIGCRNVHVMAGNATGPDAEETFVRNLIYACDQAAKHKIGLLIEPLNHKDAPGYFLNDLSVARRIIRKVGAEHLRLMFDCYHIEILHGDVLRQLHISSDIIGHIQFANVPGRGAPHEGKLDYQHLFAAIKALGYHAPLGAEYKPANQDTDASLGWLAVAKGL